MTYAVELTARARRDLAERLPEAVATACFNFVFGALAKNPQRVGKPLRDELAERYSARRGEFRVIYEIIGQRVVVRVITISHRRDVYR